MSKNIRINTEKKYPLYPQNNQHKSQTGKPLSYYTSDSDEVRLSREAIKQREQRAIRRKRQVRLQKLGLASAALMLAGTITGGIININNSNQNKSSDFGIVDFVKETLSDCETETFIPETEEPDLSVSPSTPFTDEEYINNILNLNPEVKEQYAKLQDSVSRFSNELGEDGLALIQERVDELGEGKVTVAEVLKILWIESQGRIYEPDGSGNILTSYAGGAFGPFQLTPDTVDFLNNYYGFTGTADELDIMNPYDNLDACIYNLKFLYEKRLGEIESGVTLPTGDNIGEAVAWSYHDGAWANAITNYGEDYLAKYKELSIIDEYPIDITYLINNNLC